MTEDNAPEREVLRILKEKRLTVGFAESCTGGLMAQRLTNLAGASEVMKGGVVSYTDEVKANLLRVPRALLEEKGAVSKEAALAMAEGARRVLNTDLAVSVTGVAGPGSDGRGNPVGLVYVALAAPEATQARRLMLGGGRGRIRESAADAGFEMLLEYLADGAGAPC